MSAIRSVKYFILFVLLLLFLGALPREASAMILGPTTPPAEESPSCDAFQAWLDENQDTGGTYVLDEDLVITDYLSVYLPQVPIIIEAGPHHIYVKDTALLEIIGGNITITGAGGAEGLIRISPMGTLLFEACRMTAENGTALFYEGGDPTNWSIYVGASLNGPTTIQAYGENARGIVCEQPDPLVLANLFVDTDGAGSAGVSSVSDISMTNCSVTATGLNAASVISQNGSVTGTLCRLIPEAPQFSCDNTRWVITGLDPLNFVLRPFTAFEESGLPDYVTVSITNSEDPYDTGHISLAVRWDRAAYDAGLEKNEPFTLFGTLESRDDILTDTARVPTAAISFKEASPINDLSVTTTPDVRMCRLAFDFTPPAGASFVKLQKSVDDGNSWISEDITQAYSLNAAGKACYEDILKEPGAVLYRLKVIGSAYAGYSNTVACTFESLPLTGEEPEDIDGSRGGGGRSEASRDPGSNIFENILRYTPFSSSSGSGSDGSGGIGNLNAPVPARGPDDMLRQNTASSATGADDSSGGQSHPQASTAAYTAWAVLGLLLVLLFFIGAVLWLNPAFRSRFFKK
ncbi:hypothetical protein [Eubacterium sp. 1001713B170207_170306_E7]|uniref:hypothetical protein n=1 Tax=Eubacterium sp. 1001713B170207_170306_E7 TaxID=2787097 RepID=UPI001899D47B|nr:hypothetical protein [Eubacterium sp. 1001713B170207_170306_E7]